MIREDKFDDDSWIIEQKKKREKNIRKTQQCPAQQTYEDSKDGTVSQNVRTPGIKGLKEFP